MSGIDFGAVTTWGLSGLAFGTLVAIPFYIALRMLATEVLGSPVVQAIARFAQAYTGKGGDWKSKLVGGGMKIVDRLVNG